MDAKITWTPEGAENYLGAVRLRRPTKRLTQVAYRGLMADRIDRLVNLEIQSGRDPVALAEPLMWDHDSLTPDPDPAKLGDLLAMESETLFNKTTGRQMTWPVPVQDLTDDRDAMYFLQAESLGEFLHKLYP